jgi:hypothetical protein
MELPLAIERSHAENERIFDHKKRRECISANVDHKRAIEREHVSKESLLHNYQNENKWADWVEEIHQSDDRKWRRDESARDSYADVTMMMMNKHKTRAKERGIKGHKNPKLLLVESAVGGNFDKNKHESQ